MKDCIRDVCLFSVFSGAALCLAPEGGAKRILKALITVALLGLILDGIHGLDSQAYRLELAKYREREQELIRSGEETRDYLNRLVIEQEYCAYVMEKAEQAGVVLETVDISVRWNTEGVWVPDCSVIQIREGSKETLSAILAADLGIPAEKQEWIGYD